MNYSIAQGQRLRFHRRLVGSLAAAVGVASMASCGSGGSAIPGASSTPTTITTLSPTTATVTTVPSTKPPTTPANTPAPTVEPPTTPGFATTSVASTASEATGLPPGREELSPDGLAKMIVGDDWEQDRGAEPNVKAWTIVPGVNAQIAIQGRPLEGVSTLAEYMEIYKANLAKVEIEQVQVSTITGRMGQELSVSEYRGMKNGQLVHFVTYATAVDGILAIAVQNAAEAQFEEISELARPYLETLEVVQ